MFYRILILLCCLMQLAFANSGYVTALDPAIDKIEDGSANNRSASLGGTVDVEQLQQCSDQANQRCSHYASWEASHACIMQLLNDYQKTCQQTLTLYQKLGILPSKVQAVGAVTVFTLKHLGDGEETFHMIDKTGAIIDLVDDQNPVISASKEFKEIQKNNPGSGLMPLVAGKISQSPQVIQPKKLANTKDEDMTQLIFRQYVNLPACISCRTVAIADIDYQFSYPQGKFLTVKWLKTETNNVQPDVMDMN